MMIKKICMFLKIYKWKKKGFSRENVNRFIVELEKDKKRNYDKKILKFARKHEFFAETVVALGINESNYKEYLNDYDYWRMFPLDGRYHSWIDNKLDLKYLLGDLGCYMPEYYFQITQDLGILRLLDCYEKYENSFEGIYQLLKEKTKLGIKDMFGYGGKDFYKAEFINNDIFINNKKYTIEEFKKFILGLDNFLIMEYLESSGLPAKIYPKTANSIRYIIGIENGKQYKLGNFIKFGRKDSGYVDNRMNGGIPCPIDEKGNFEFGYEMVNGVMKKIENHPDTGQKLSGHIDEWSEIEEIVQKILKRLPQLTHLGFDFVVSDKGIKLLEINDKSGFLVPQKYKPFLKDREDNFYLKRLEKVERKIKNVF